MRKSMKKRLVSGIVMVGLVSTMILTGCGSSKTTTGSSTASTGSGAGEDSGKLKIGMSVYDLSSPYWVALTKGAQEKADELGYELIIDDPKSDAAKQVTSIDNFIAMGCDAIIVAPLDKNACEGSVQKAKEKGIYVIAQSSATDTYDVWVSAAEYKMGYACGTGAADWIVEHYGKDADITCAVLSWDKISTQVARGDGIQDAIKEKAPNVKFVRQDANSTTEGQNVADALLQANPDLKVIACMNDAGAIGAYSAVQAAGKDNDDFYIGGNDATDEAIALIKKGGAFRATVDITPEENGKTDVELAQKLANGESVPDTYEIEANLLTQDEIMNGK